MIEEVENFRGSPRFKVGREAGRFDRGSELPSESAFFNEQTDKLIEGNIINISFQELDPAYCQGYELGYEEGPQDDTKKKTRKY